MKREGLRKKKSYLRVSKQRKKSSFFPCLLHTLYSKLKSLVDQVYLTPIPFVTMLGDNCYYEPSLVMLHSSFVMRRGDRNMTRGWSCGGGAQLSIASLDAQDGLLLTPLRGPSSAQDNPRFLGMQMELHKTISLGKAGARECQRCSVELQCSGKLVLGNANNAQWNYSARESQCSGILTVLNGTVVLGKVSVQECQWCSAE